MEKMTDQPQTRFLGTQSPLPSSPEEALLDYVPNPRPGDRGEIDGDAFLVQGEPVRDRERLVWTADLRPA